ncbi:MAG TPA: hypothetical protein VJ952_09525 [Opitutales bacterium]|nr:hypothetical protein [Opitutales bacterium]
MPASSAKVDAKSKMVGGYAKLMNDTNSMEDLLLLFLKEEL